MTSYTKLFGKWWIIRVSDGEKIQQVGSYYEGLDTIYRKLPYNERFTVKRIRKNEDKGNV